MKNQKEEELTSSQDSMINLKNTCLYILDSILQYTSTHKKKSPSIFDNHSDVNGETNIIDEYDFDDLFQFCIKLLKLDENLLILIMMNIDKIISNDNFALTYKNINRLFYTCLMITQKYYEDNSWNNKLYADLVGISCDELLDMEMEYMNLINFHLFIRDEDFAKYKQRLINCMNHIEMS